MHWVIKPEGHRIDGRHFEVAVLAENGGHLLGGIWKEGKGYSVFAGTANGPFGRDGIPTREEAVTLLRQCLE